MSTQKIVIHCQDGPYCTVEVHLPEKSFYSHLETISGSGRPQRVKNMDSSASVVSVASLSSVGSERKKPHQGPPPILATNTNIFRPAVIRRLKDRFDPIKDGLPLGIQLTGGEKLRKAGLTGKGIRVGVIDSGVDRDHPGFDGMVKHQMWFRHGTPLIMDDHGTHVAGTIHMMAPDAEIYDYRVFGEDGGVGVEDAIMIAIFEACFDGCHVINMSLGGRWPSASIRNAVQFAESKGVIVICAAGNEGDNNPLTNERSYPALWDEVISVAAVSKKGGLPVARFSNSNPQVDVAGIGVKVVSFKPGRGYQEMSGTSMASPHVAGLTAALLSDWRDDGETEGGDTAKPTSRRKESMLRTFLEKTNIIDIGKAGHDKETGVGFLTFLERKEYDGLIGKL